MLSGCYYPPEIIRFHRLRQGSLIPGERILQETHILGIPIWSMVEIFLADRTANSTKIGYVTTRCHHGRGIWQAHLTRNSDHLTLRVFSTAGPQSVWFWLGLPIARAMQLRARNRAIARFRASA